MVLTLEKLLNDPDIIRAVIDRTIAVENDRIYWRDYLDFEQTPGRTFKTYIGNVTRVVMGSVIDRNSNKPIRKRRSLASGVGEVAILGNSYQMDIDRLDQLQLLIDKFNAEKRAGQPAVLNEIITFIVDDFRQCTLAPNKRMDYVVGQLRSTGKASVKFDDNKEGIELIDLELPVVKKVAVAADKTKLVAFIRSVTEQMRPGIGTFAVMEMTRTTFNNRLLKSDEFKDTYKMILSNSEIALSGGLITDAMANQLVTGIGLPPIKLVEEYVEKEDGTIVNAFADDKISLLPAGKLGKMRWHTPYEITDRVPGKTYTQLAGGHFISTIRTDEGRFTEYMAEWIPEFRAPNKIAILDLSELGE